jgi:hypothetical protein
MSTPTPSAVRKDIGPRNAEKMKRDEEAQSHLPQGEEADQSLLMAHNVVLEAQPTLA